MWQRSKEPLIVVLVLLILPVAARYYELEPEEPGFFYHISLFLPFVFFCLGALTAIKLNQARIALTCVCFGVTLLLLNTQWLTHYGLDVKTRLAVMALPLSLFVLFLIRESSILHFRALAMAVAALCVFLGTLSAFEHGYLSWFPFFATDPAQATLWDLPTVGICLALLFAVQTFILQGTDSRSLHAFTALALIPSFYGLHRIEVMLPNQEQALFEAGCAFSVAGALVAYAVFLSYWRKVYIDELTGLPNRRALEETLDNLRGGFAIAMIDIDHFKRFNDQYGHETGDNVLQFVATQLGKTKDPQIYRYGGEEFCAVFRHLASTEAAARHMDEIRDKMEQRKFYIRDSDARKRAQQKGHEEPTEAQEVKRTTIIRVTVSAGVASKNETLVKPRKVLAAADAALYEAKENGRNQVCQA